MKGIKLTESEATELGRVEVDGSHYDFKTGKLKKGGYFMCQTVVDSLPKTLKYKIGVKKTVSVSINDFVE